MVYDYNPGLSRGYGDNTTAVRAEELRLPRFFMNYQSHSEQLADALQGAKDYGLHRVNMKMDFSIRKIP